MKKIISVVGARPNFMKMAPVHKAFQIYADRLTSLICHTGQHYDEKMSQIFFDELNLPKPDFYLGIGSGSHAVQTASIMVEFEKIIIKEQPDMVIVFGDVNSTVACSLVAAKFGIKIAHVEAGLRSFDNSMPEEINRRITDVLADFLFVTEKSGMDNLLHEGIDSNKIFFVGNAMIDSLVSYLPIAEQSNIFTTLNINKHQFVLVTLHRPSNVDDKENLESLFKVLNIISQRATIVFPVHPRTQKNIAAYGLSELLNDNIILTGPLGYVDFLALTKYSKLIITDSGGIQEESTYLQVQCLTVRENTERPSTVDEGTNRLLGRDWEKIQQTAIETLEGKTKKGKIPDLWDGGAGKRIAGIIVSLL